MGHNDHINFQLHDVIRDLAEKGSIEAGTPAYGVAQQVIHSGYESLTTKQRALYDAVIGPALAKQADEIRTNEIMNSAPP